MQHHVKHFCKIIAMCLAIILMIPSYANAAFVEPIEPLASDYLTSYQAYVYPAGSGEIQVWFSVSADDYMDDVGALWIQVYESSDKSTWTYNISRNCR